MEKRTLYRVTRSDGGVDVTPNKPSDETPYSETFRLIADEGKILTDGVNTYPCIDTDYPESFLEVDDLSYTEAEVIT